MREGFSYVQLIRKRGGLPAKGLRAVSLLAGLFERDIRDQAFLETFGKLKDTDFDYICCHDLVLLPLACAVRGLPQNRERCKIIFDAREFYPRQFEDRRLWRLILGPFNDYLAKQYLCEADAVFTVSPGLAAGYAKDYNIVCEVLPSYACFVDIAPQSAKKGIMRCIHHGGAFPGRGIEKLIEAMRLLGEGYSLDLMLLPDAPAYYEKLQKLVAKEPNVRIIAPVPMPEIVSAISQYDVGVFLLDSDNFNHRYFLPNKLFEFIQARLAVVVSPNPDMADLVSQYKLGAVTSEASPQALAQALENLSCEELESGKRAAHTTAQRLCWENNHTRIKELLQKLRQE